MPLLKFQPSYVHMYVYANRDYVVMCIFDINNNDKIIMKTIIFIEIVFHQWIFRNCPQIIILQRNKCYNDSPCLVSLHYHQIRHIKLYLVLWLCLHTINSLRNRTLSNAEYPFEKFCPHKVKYKFRQLFVTYAGINCGFGCCNSSSTTETFECWN